MTNEGQQENQPRRWTSRWAVLFVLALVTSAIPDISIGGGAKETLHELRALRRIAGREQALEKSGQPATFGLLVIPVSFVDTAFPDSWSAVNDLAPRLTGTATSTLENYFDVASGGLLDLRITLAPAVELTEKLSYYVDPLGDARYLRTRLMARESLEAVRELGLEFRSLDMDGPDGLPGSGDDDGQVDGVLLLHAGIGLENDFESGQIPAQQFFLEEPVVSGGVGASFYAVAGHSSGLGIWAHETGHLLGMEDRYDPLLRTEGAGEVRSKGGLGRFSLMASGAWGTGGGRQPALPDAYTCLQQGWLSSSDLDVRGDQVQEILPGLDSGKAYRIWTNGQYGSEFLLVETRDPAAAYPFDAGLPAGNLLVYHVDESLPERFPVDPGDGHLRVRLVEADGVTGLAEGLDDGSNADLFPGPENVQRFGPATLPSSDGYSGPSGIVLSEITAGENSVSLISSALLAYGVEISFGWSGDSPAVLEFSAREVGEAFSGLQAELSVDTGLAWGAFGGGGTDLVIDLVENEAGLWAPAETVIWNGQPDAPAGATTAFTIRLVAPVWVSNETIRPWVWSPSSDTLDFAGLWPGQWTTHAEGNFGVTSWTRWATSPWLTDNSTPVLACVDEIFSDSSEWPDVRYNNNGYATITSGPLDSSVRGIRLLHAIEADLLNGATAQDGGQVRWVGPDGTEVLADPVDGWETVVDVEVASPVAGQGVLVGTKPFLRDDRPVWNTDVFAVPEGGQGPWRLQLVFSSDWLGYYRGWFIADIEPLYDSLPTSAYDIRWGPGAGLSWTWPLDDAGEREFLIEAYDPGTELWYPLADRTFTADAVTGRFELTATEALAGLHGDSRNRTRVRAVSSAPIGLLATRPVVIYPDGGPGEPALLGAPWPNPSPTGTVRFLAQIPDGPNTLLSIYDLKGRLIRSWSLPSGNHFLLWRGTDSNERRVAAGTYFLRIQGSGEVSTHKVVLLH